MSYSEIVCNFFLFLALVAILFRRAESWWVTVTVPLGGNMLCSFLWEEPTVPFEGQWQGRDLRRRITMMALDRSPELKLALTDILFSGVESF